MAAEASARHPLLKDFTSVFDEPVTFLHEQAHAPIAAYRIGKDAYVWDSKDAMTLRMKYRIVGAAAGTLPKAIGDSDSQLLPIKLLPEEVRLGLERSFIVLHESGMDSYRAPDEAARQNYMRRRPSQAGAGAPASAEPPLDLEKPPPPERREEWLRLRREQRDLAKRAAEPYFLAVAESQAEPAERLFQPHREISAVEWWYPATDRQRLEYAVFRFIWERGYTLTPGSKFGGQYLAYEADPMSVHAAFAITAIEWDKTFAPLDIVATGRVGVTVKKSPVLFSRSPRTGLMCAFTVAWEGST